MTTSIRSLKIENAKKIAAYKAVDTEMNKSIKVVGIGSGTTIVYVAERLGQLDYKKEFVCIPTGFQSQQLIIKNDLVLGSIEQFPQVGITFDGADEIDKNLNLIKGGGGCLFQEKLLAISSNKVVVIADERKMSHSVLGKVWTKGIPIEVVPKSYVRIFKDLHLLGAKSINLRDGTPFKSGPVITDNNNFLIDADFGPIYDAVSLNNKIKMLVGVVETGIFINLACKFYIGKESGELDIFTK